MGTSTELTLNRDFADWVRRIKNEIRSAQLKAATKVNSELLHLYWHMGAEICEKQKSATWGDGLLICKDKNDVMAQYSLEASAYPIGISEYQLSQLMPEDLKSQLPAIEEIEASLGGFV